MRAIAAERDQSRHDPFQLVEFQRFQGKVIHCRPNCRLHIFEGAETSHHDYHRRRLQLRWRAKRRAQ